MEETNINLNNNNNTSNQNSPDKQQSAPNTPRDSNSSPLTLSPSTTTTWRSSKPTTVHIDPSRVLLKEHSVDNLPYKESTTTITASSTDENISISMTSSTSSTTTTPSWEGASISNSSSTSSLSLQQLSISSESSSPSLSGSSNSTSTSSTNNANSTGSNSSNEDNSNNSSWWSKLKIIGNANTSSNSNNNNSNSNINISNNNININNNNNQGDEDGGEVIYHSTPSSKIIREGVLNKQGHLRKNWLPRYFILTDTALEYYREKGQQILNTIPLSECTIELADTETKKAFCFKISHPTRKSFYLLSNSPDIERDSYEWIGAIQEVVDTLAANALANGANQIGVAASSTVVTESHRSYELVHAISNALLYSLGKTSAAAVTDLCIEDFTASEPQSVQQTPTTTGKTAVSYRFVDYAPKVFRKIRELSNVNSADFMLSLTRDTLSEIPTPGRSSSFFYFTSDKKYLIKTITSAEFDHLRSILTNYYFHLSQNRDSLLVRFYGLHHISPTKMKNTYFVVMENVFENRSMDEIYDLKGSTLHRKAESGKTVLMDLDFCTRIFISDDMKQKFYKQIETDCNFLEKNVTMDYSLLLGIQYIGGTKVVSSDDDSMSLFRRECGGMVSRTSSGELYDRIYYIAIIDILTTYSIKKQLEHTYKATIYDTKEGMSAVDPATYNKRFIRFVSKITGWKTVNNSD